MTTIQRICAFDSSSPDYHKAFQVFLDHTDQKAKAREWLGRLVAALPSKETFIDAGAGNGKVTAWFMGQFKRTIAAEPNPSLRAELARACPRAQVLDQTILEAPVPAKGDFVLASHVFYYIPESEWLANLERLVSWLAPQGALVVILQNHQSDCMRMLRHFLGRSFDLQKLAAAFEEKHAENYQVSMDSVPCHVTTDDEDSAYQVAEFMLNLLPLKEPPPAAEVREYIQSHFVSGGRWRFSCTQDFLQVRPAKI